MELLQEQTSAHQELSLADSLTNLEASSSKFDEQEIFTTRISKNEFFSELNLIGSSVSNQIAPLSFTRSDHVDDNDLRETRESVLRKNIESDTPCK